MGVVGVQDDYQRTELEEIRHLSKYSCARTDQRKNPEDFDGRRMSPNTLSDDDDEKVDEELVCVTSSVSIVGLAVINQLLIHGYSVRIIVDNSDSEMPSTTENNHKLSIVRADLTKCNSLVDAFEGCRGVFHTSDFVDPAGLTGYSRAMAEVEKNVSENVMEACARTSSVRHCVLTSSLLACIWRGTDTSQGAPISSIVNHHSWSDQSFCRDKKLWYALGKLKAEKAAWRIAREKGLKLTTICPGLVTDPDHCFRNSTATMAYLKGGQEMFEKGLLATVKVSTLAEANMKIYKSMVENEAHGRYICYDHIISTVDEAQSLAMELGFPITKFCQNQNQNPSSSSPNPSARFQLSNSRLLNLTLAKAHPCYYETLNPNT